VEGRKEGERKKEKKTLFSTSCLCLFSPLTSATQFWAPEATRTEVHCVTSCFTLCTHKYICTSASSTLLKWVVQGLRVWLKCYTVA
jgi:hypothetical protein